MNETKRRFNYILGICGANYAGKDTLFDTISDILKVYYVDCQRVALADLLKLEVDSFCRQHYGVSSFSKEKKDKELIRGILIEHGRAKRTISNGTYWTGLVEKRINEILDDGGLPCITDIRYCNPEYSNDELQWLRKKNGILIHVERFLSNGQPNLPNNEEKKYDTILKENADFKVKWQTTLDKNYWQDTVNLQLKDLINKIIND